jgi:putative redox protein
MGKTEVQVDLKGRYRCVASARQHRWTGDEPEGVGGSDMGPSPYEMLMGALGSCTAMTLRMYAERKGWPLTGVSVRLSYGKVHKDDCDECDRDDPRSLIDKVDREIALTGDLTDEQRRRLVEIATRCPVHRTMTAGTVIVDRLVSGL